MRPSSIAYLTLPFIVHTSSAASDLATPPVSPVRQVIDDYHGTRIADAYRYMENLKDPEVLAWMKGQSNYATSALDQLPARKALLERIQTLDKGAPYTIGDLNRLKGGSIFYQKLNAGAEMRVVCSRPSVTGE